MLPEIMDCTADLLRNPCLKIGIVVDESRKQSFRQTARVLISWSVDTDRL